MGNAKSEYDRKRQRSKRIDPDRVAGGFATMPHDVMDSAAYLQLSPSAKALLFELARQYGPGWNGRLLLSQKKLRPRGWTSSDVLHRAKRELLEAGFIIEMVKGHRPNKASWYAVTWYSLVPSDKYDPGTDRIFRRGMYRTLALKNSCLTPLAGSVPPWIAPADGRSAPPVDPCAGAVRQSMPSALLRPAETI